MYSDRISAILKREGISFGDRVKASQKGGKEYAGILMPRIMGDSDTIILKLDSGYNIGLKADSLNKLPKEKRHEDSAPPRKVAQDSGLPEISILTTGGTISSKIDYATGGVISSLSPDEILSSIPELAKIVRIKNVVELFRIWSENMSSTHWKKMAEEVARELNSGAEGVIIFHGTDTIGYSAAALSFMLRNLEKPVIITGAQRSTDRGSSDTAFNVICAAHAARSNIAGVMVCMHAEMSDTYCNLIRGTKVRKMHTSRRDTFRPVNDLPIAKVWPDGRMEHAGHSMPGSGGDVVADTKFEEKVAMLKAYPGSDPEIIDFLVKKKYRGIVVEATGLGHTHDNWLPGIKKAVSHGVVVAYAPQALYGSLNPLVYESARRAQELGVIHCGDMLPETAYVKLGWVLGRTKSAEAAKKMMLENVAGEMSGRDIEGTFLY